MIISEILAGFFICVGVFFAVNTVLPARMNRRSAVGESGVMGA